MTTFLLRHLPFFLVLCISLQVQAQEITPATFQMKWGDTMVTMKQYHLCLLKAGDQRQQDSLSTSSIQQAHLAYLQTLEQQGKTVLTGPLSDPTGQLRGIVVFRTSAEEAIALISADPSVKSGRLVFEIIPWWSRVGSVLY